MGLEIRYCKVEDFSQVYHLLKQMWPGKELNSEEMSSVFNNSLLSDKQKLIVALLQNKIVGFCSLTIKNDLIQAGSIGYVDILVVDGKSNGRGIGQQLLTKITEIAVENKCKKIELDSDFNKKTAHAFYEKTGYENRAFVFSKILEN